MYTWQREARTKEVENLSTAMIQHLVKLCQGASFDRPNFFRAALNARPASRNFSRLNV